MARNETQSEGASPMGWHYRIDGPHELNGSANVYRCKVGQVWERCEIYDLGEMSPDELRFIADLIDRAKTKIVLHELKKTA